MNYYMRSILKWYVSSMSKCYLSIIKVHKIDANLPLLCL